MAKGIRRATEGGPGIDLEPTVKGKDSEEGKAMPKRRIENDKQFLH
jgi:hypothetical protein